MTLMRDDWQEQFAEQNRLLVDSGEEPVTALEFIQRRLEDAENALAAIGELPAKWRAKAKRLLGNDERVFYADELETVLEQHDV